MTHEEIEAATERLNILDDSNRSYSMRDVARALIGEDSVPIRFSHTIAYLLQQADPDTHMVLPVDADGEYIHIGDEVCGYDHPKGGVYCHAIVNPRVIAVGDKFAYGNSKGWVLWSTLNVSHHHKLTVEDVLREFANEVYADADNEIHDRDFLCAKYAKKLREVMADDDR